MSIASNAFTSGAKMLVDISADNDALRAYFTGKNISCTPADAAPFTITYRANGGLFADGSTEQIALCHWHKPIPMAAPPALAGMALRGWFLDAACTQPFEDSVMPPRDLTLYAGWTPYSANVRYTVADGQATLTGYDLVVNEGTRVYLPDTVDGYPLTGIADYALMGQEITHLYIPASITRMSSEAFSGMSQLESVVVSADNPAFRSVEGVVYSKDMTTLVRMPAKGRTVFYLPEEVLHIADYAFQGSRITDVVLNDRLQRIGKSAFEETGLTGITLPDSLTEVGEKAFYRCEGIGTFRGTANIRTIGAWAFEASAFQTMYGPTEDCVFKAYAEQYGHLYNYYILTLSANGKASTRLVQAGDALDKLPIDGTAQLLATVAPVNATVKGLVWQSSAPEIVSVTESGLVTAHRRGRAVITATAHNGAAATAEVIVYTIDLPVPEVTEVQVEESIQLAAIALLDESPMACTWAVDHADWATVDETGLVTFQHAGFVMVTMTVTEVNETRTVRLSCYPDKWITLPAAMTAIGEETFMGSQVASVRIHEGVTAIGPKAFADCMNLGRVDIPASVTEIAEDAFVGAERVVLFVPEDSYAQIFAQEHGLEWILVKE